MRDAAKWYVTLELAVLANSEDEAKRWAAEAVTARRNILTYVIGDVERSGVTPHRTAAPQREGT